MSVTFSHPCAATRRRACASIPSDWYADDPPLGADAALQRFEVLPRTASDVQDGEAGAKIQRADEGLPEE